MVRYYPKNRIKPNQYTSGGEYSLDGTSYTGDYYRTFDGLTFTGKDPNAPGANRQLFPLNAPVAQVANNAPSPGFNGAPVQGDLDRFAVLGAAGGLDASDAALNVLTPFYPQPTSEDYSKGYFIRYFAKKVNGVKEIIEVSKVNFEAMRNRTVDQETYLYEVVDVFWKITGPERDDRTSRQYPIAGVYDTNKRIVEQKDKAFPGLINYIGGNYTKYWLNGVR